VAYPNGLADRSGNIYILGFIPGFIFELCKIETTTGTVTVVAGGGSPSTGSVMEDRPQCLDFPVLSILLLGRCGDRWQREPVHCRHGYYRIRKVTAATGIITTVAGDGTSGYTGDGGPAIAAELSRPTGVLVDGSGNLYILDTSRIRKVDAGTGTITTVAGSGNPAFCVSVSGDGGPAVSAVISPVSATIDGSGNLFIADSCSQSIRKVDAKTGIITTVAGLRVAMEAAVTTAMVSRPRQPD